MKTTEPIYNGKSIREILKNLPKSFSKIERNWYIKNCIEVYKNASVISYSGYIQNVLNTNFRLIQNHINN